MPCAIPSRQSAAHTTGNPTSLLIRGKPYLVLFLFLFFILHTFLTLIEEKFSLENWRGGGGLKTV